MRRGRRCAHGCTMQGSVGAGGTGERWPSSLRDDPMRPVGVSHVENQEGNHPDGFSGRETEKWMGRCRALSVAGSLSQMTVLMFPSLLPRSSLPSPFPFLHFYGRMGFLSLQSFLFSPSPPAL